MVTRTGNNGEAGESFDVWSYRVRHSDGSCRGMQADKDWVRASAQVGWAGQGGRGAKNVTLRPIAGQPRAHIEVQGRGGRSMHANSHDHRGLP